MQNFKILLVNFTLLNSHRRLHSIINKLDKECAISPILRSILAHINEKRDILLSLLCVLTRYARAKFFFLHKSSLLRTLHPVSLEFVNVFDFDLLTISNNRKKASSTFLFPEFSLPNN